MMMVVVFVVVEVDDSAFGSDGEEIGGGCHGGSDGSILVVEAFDASSASDVPSVENDVMLAFAIVRIESEEAKLNSFINQFRVAV